ncbi:MAG TPA: FRG domain-containing protein [Roseiflexaceae bacterium]|nr:FRG domain-containing protein [Roseiflexaceae bacterium]
MDELRPTTWNELTDGLFADTWREDLRRHRSNRAFRGMPDATYDLRTSLMRLGEGFAGLEAHLLRAFQRYARPYVGTEGSVWSWLALAQHHGLPTRLLDWTYSPFVALHFATADPHRMDVDGVIWAADYVRSSAYLPGRLREILREEGTSVFTTEMLDRAADSLADLDSLAEEPFAVFFEPPSLDDRIVNQFALFALLSRPEARMDHWLAARPALARRIVLPAALKWEARDRLDQLNMTERVLFPGLDGLSAWLTRYYRPRTRG